MSRRVPASKSIQKLVSKGKCSLGELACSLADVSLHDLSNEEIVNLNRGLSMYGSAVDAVARYPGFYRKCFDESIYYFDVKGDLTERQSGFYSRRLAKLRGMLMRAASKHPDRANEIYVVEMAQHHTLDEVIAQFEGLDVNREQNLQGALDGMGVAFACPQILPDSAVKIFEGRWYVTKQFHSDYGYGLKSVELLNKDKRKPLFLDGVSRLARYLEHNNS